MNAIKHFKTITNHKMLVMKYCFKVGMIKQGLLHDLSKYTPVEFNAGIKYYKGDVSPNGIQKREEGYSAAWLHHKGRNKHHFEYWLDYGLDPSKGIVGMEMPLKYVIEMFIDRMCACKNYEKERYTDRSPLNYYNRNREHYVLHPNTKILLEQLLDMLADKGEEYTLEYVKKLLKNI